MIILVILIFTCFSDCKSYENYAVENTGNSVVSANQASNSGINITSQIPPPNKSVFTKTDALVIFRWDNDIIQRENGLIHIYDEAGNVWLNINYYDDSVDSMLELRDKFRPSSFRTGDFELEFNCVGKSKDWYEVIVQELVSPPIKKYIKVNDPLFEFQTWEQYILDYVWIVFDQEKNPILQSPNGKKKGITLSEEIRVVPVTMEGDWIKIRWGKGEPDQIKNFNDNNFGWIRWKKGDEILIHDFYP